MAAWPVDLPEFFRVASYSETSADNLIRTKMDVGPAKVRRRTGTNVRRVSGSMWLTPTQYTSMETFFNVTQDHGATTFTMDDAHGINQTWRFVSPPSYTTVGPENWQVRLNLEQMP